MPELIIIAHNIRSTHNVGSLFRTAEGLGVKKLYLTGYTPYPSTKSDQRMPHEARRTDYQINKTALGAQSSLAWQQCSNIEELLKKLKAQGYGIYAIEQTTDARSLIEFVPPPKTVLVFGNERIGLNLGVIDLCDQSLYIPMLGKKESYNVVQAAAMAIYHCRFLTAK